MSPTRPPRPDAPSTDLHRLSASVDRLTAHADNWSTGRLLDEGLDLVRDVSWADSCALLRVSRGRVHVVHARPGLPGEPAMASTATAGVSTAIIDGPADEGGGHDAPGSAEVPIPPVDSSVPVAWFPWGLAPIEADRFVLVDDARSLPASPVGPTTLGALGVRSCLHLPLRQRGRTVGAVHLFWNEPRLAWDDDRGRLLRTLGRFLLTCQDPVPTRPDPT